MRNSTFIPRGKMTYLFIDSLSGFFNENITDEHLGAVFQFLGQGSAFVTQVLIVSPLAKVLHSTL
jgi:hypothetical protein